MLVKKPRIKHRYTTERLYTDYRATSDLTHVLQQTLVSPFFITISAADVFVWTFHRVYQYLQAGQHANRSLAVSSVTHQTHYSGSDPKSWSGFT